MKNQKTISLFICLVAYYFFFWEEKLGLNLFIFNFLLLGLNYPEMPKNKITFLLLAVAFISSISVLLINTEIGILINLLIMMVVLGYNLLPQINSAISAGLVLFLNTVHNIRQLATPISSILEGMAPKSEILNSILKIVKISVLPIALFLLFIMIFQTANPIFLEKTLFLQQAFEVFIKEFPTFSIPRTAFTVFGYIILSGIFFNRNLQFGLKYFTNKNTSIKPPKDEIGNEMFQTVTISLLGLNALLLSVNFIDIQYLWFNFADTSAAEMSKLVHSGTYLLIISVLISIAILVFFFKGDLNFHKKIKLLTSLALAWIAQNMILIGSVFIRNYKYVEMYGLTHKRIGVSVFLILALIALFTITWKIIKKLNINFLFISNSWAFMLVLLVLGFVNFDKVIAENNLKRPNCDLEYVKSLSIHAIPSILKYHPELKKEDINSYKWHVKESKSHTWLSWSLMDYKLKNTK
jgi:hypothetical protein